MAMQFLTQRPVPEPSDDGGKYTSFFADVSAPRPPFDEIVGVTHAAASLAKSMAKLLSRKASPVSSVSLVIDGIGACLLVSTSKRMQVQKARSAIDTVIAALPAAQRRSVEKKIRPLDELDKRRIEDWFLASPLKHDEVPEAAAPEVTNRTKVKR